MFKFLTKKVINKKFVAENKLQTLNLIHVFTSCFKYFQSAADCKLSSLQLLKFARILRSTADVPKLHSSWEHKIIVTGHHSFWIDDGVLTSHFAAPLYSINYCLSFWKPNVYPQKNYIACRKSIEKFPKLPHLINKSPSYGILLKPLTLRLAFHLVL